MTPYNLFEQIRTATYKTSGDCVDWAIDVCDSEKTIFLLFEPSKQKRDWINNFNFPVKIYKKQQSCLMVARGWGRAYKSCNDEIMEALIKMVKEKPDYQVLISGWSYGGAMSLIAAEEFYFRTRIKPSVITFGAPKPLWGRKTKNYCLSCVRDVKQYAHINDIIPYLPPALFGYKHLVKNKIGKDFSILKLFKPQIFHCSYGDKTLYCEDTK